MQPLPTSDPDLEQSTLIPVSSSAPPSLSSLNQTQLLGLGCIGAALTTFFYHTFFTFFVPFLPATSPYRAFFPAQHWAWDGPLLLLAFTLTPLFVVLSRHNQQNANLWRGLAVGMALVAGITLFMSGLNTPT